MSLTSAGSSSACAPASGEAAFIALLQAHRLSPRSSNLRLCWRIAGARARLAVDAQHTLPKLDTSLPDQHNSESSLDHGRFCARAAPRLDRGRSKLRG